MLKLAFNVVLKVVATNDFETTFIIDIKDKKVLYKKGNIEGYIKCK